METNLFVLRKKIQRLTQALFSLTMYIVNHGPTVHRIRVMDNKERERRTNRQTERLTDRKLETRKTDCNIAI